MRLEVHALFLDLPKTCKGKDLKSAGIRQDRTVPVHKFVQSAEFSHHLVPRTYMKMIRVGKLNLCADLL